VKSKVRVVSTAVAWIPTGDFLRQLLPEIMVSNEGVELLTLRVPQGLSGTPETLRVIWDVTWEELLEYGLWDMEAQMREQGLYTTVMLAERLDRKPDWVRHQVKIGNIPDPDRRYRKGMIWTEDEAQAIEVSMNASPAPESLNKLGLPRKDRYASGDVCKVLGIKYERLRHLLDAGKLPDSEERTERGQRRWTEAEVGAVVEASKETHLSRSR
jgi:hypothetical protein